MSIEAMKQVPLVEQLESVPTDARLVIDDADGMGTHFIPVGRMCHDAANAITAIEQAEKQEPVAWMTHTNDLMPLFHMDRKSALNWETQPTPLYTAPPKPEWVGLTQLEINEIVDGNIKITDHLLRDAIEAVVVDIEITLMGKNNYA